MVALTIICWEELIVFEILRIYNGRTIRGFFIEANIFRATVIEFLYSFNTYS